MDIDNNWFWLLVAFWLGTFVGVAALALMQAGRNADVRRAKGIRTMQVDLLSDTVSRF